MIWDVLVPLSGDITQSYSKTYDNEKINGMSFKLNYAKTFDEYHSTIYFCRLSFLRKTFRSFSQYIDERYNGINNNGYEKKCTPLPVIKLLGR